MTNEIVIVLISKISSSRFAWYGTRCTMLLHHDDLPCVFLIKIKSSFNCQLGCLLQQ